MPRSRRLPTITAQELLSAWMIAAKAIIEKRKGTAKVAPPRMHCDLRLRDRKGVFA
jgi:hypothetical protein